MSESRQPVGFDSNVLAGLLRDILTELQTLNTQPPSEFKRLFGNIYLRMKRGGDGS